MAFSDLQMQLIKWISAQEDTESLVRLKGVMDDIDYDRQSDMKVIGYRPNGVRIIKSDFIRCIKQAEDEISRGHFLSIEEVEKISSKW